MKDFQGKIIVILTSSGVPSLYPLVMLSCEWLKCDQMSECGNKTISTEEAVWEAWGDCLLWGVLFLTTALFFANWSPIQLYLLNVFISPSTSHGICGSFSQSLRTCCVFNEWNLPLACHSQNYAVLVVGDFDVIFPKWEAYLGTVPYFPARSCTLLNIHSHCFSTLEQG